MTAMPVETQVENKYLEFKKSGIHNYGAFALKPIRKGTRIIEYIGRPLTKKKAQAALQDGNAYVFTINKHLTSMVKSHGIPRDLSIMAVK